MSFLPLWAQWEPLETPLPASPCPSRTGRPSLVTGIPNITMGNGCIDLIDVDAFAMGMSWIIHDDQ